MYHGLFHKRHKQVQSGLTDMAQQRLQIFLWQAPVITPW
jgi:hypothetical protein